MKKLRYFFETALVASAAWILPRLPRPVIMALARGVGRLACLIDARGRRTARQNLRAAFGGSLSEAEVRRITLGSYQNFARTFLDLFWAQALTLENWGRHVSIRLDDPEAEAKAQRDETSRFEAELLAQSSANKAAREAAAAAAAETAKFEAEMLAQVCYFIIVSQSLELLI